MKTSRALRSRAWTALIAAIAGLATAGLWLSTAQAEPRLDMWYGDALVMDLPDKGEQAADDDDDDVEQPAAVHMGTDVTDNAGERTKTAKLTLLDSLAQPSPIGYSDNDAYRLLAGYHDPETSEGFDQDDDDDQPDDDDNPNDDDDDDDSGGSDGGCGC